MSKTITTATSTSSIPLEQIKSSTVPSTNSGNGKPIHRHPTPIISMSDSSPRLYLLYGIIILQVTIFLTELITDQFTHSLLILTDAYHHLFNACNAILLVVCFKISNQSSLKNTFGWVRLEVLGMLTTITFIVALIFSLLIEGILQIMHLHEIIRPTNFKVLTNFGIWSLVVNILYVLIINGVITETKYKTTTHSERSFSSANCELTAIPAISVCARIESISPPVTRELLEVIDTPTTTSDQTSQQQQPQQIKQRQSDSNDLPVECFVGSFFQGILSPVLVLIGAGGIYFYPVTNITNIVEPGLGVFTAIILCITFYPQLKNTVLILLQTVPENVDIVVMKKEILKKFPLFQNIHELHVWRLNNANIVATCHIVLPYKQTTRQYSRLFDSFRAFLLSQYTINHVTIQPEFLSWNPQDAGKEHDEQYQVSENACFMKCPPSSTTTGGGDHSTVDGSHNSNSGGDSSDQHQTSDCHGMKCCMSGADLQKILIQQSSHHGHSH